MGISPEAMGRLSLWQFLAIADGWAQAHDPEAVKRSNDDEDFDDVAHMLDAAPDVMN